MMGHCVKGREREREEIAIVVPLQQGIACVSLVSSSFLEMAVRKKPQASYFQKEKKKGADAGVLKGGRLQKVQ